MELSNPTFDEAIRLASTPIHTQGHTAMDFAELVAAGVNPGDCQPREHSVRCRELGCPRFTANVAGRCDHPGHYVAPGIARKAAHPSAPTDDGPSICGAVGHGYYDGPSCPDCVPTAERAAVMS